MFGRTSIENKITALTGKLEVNHARQAELRAERPSHAYPAEDGDSTAKAAIAKIDKELDALGREAQTLTDARAHAESLRLDEARKGHDEYWRRECEAADGLAQKVIEAAERFDQKARELVEAIEDLRRAAGQLRSCECVNRDAVGKLLRKGPIERALGVSGLRQYVDLPGASMGGLEFLQNTAAGLVKARIERPPFTPPPAVTVSTDGQLKAANVAEAVPMPPPGETLASAWPRLAAEAMAKGKAANQNGETA